MRYAGPLVVVAATAAVLGYSLAASSASTAAPQDEPVAIRVSPLAGDAGPPPEMIEQQSSRKHAVRITRARTRHHPPLDIPGGEHPGALGEADGAVPAGTTVFDDQTPGVGNLDPALAGALRRAAADAEKEGIGFIVNSGWRSAEYQAQLLREAVSKYGSEEEAARWVAAPNESAHVSGEAVDVGTSDATGWLSQHGSEYGLCQIYSNEPWHYELRPRAIDRGCPPMYVDPSQRKPSPGRSSD